MGFTISGDDNPKTGGFTIEPDTSAPKKSASFLESPLAVGGEMALSLGTAIPATAIGSVAGLMKGLFGGKYGTREGAQEASKYASDVAQNLTYSPRGEMAQQGMADIGGALESSKLAGLGPTEAIALNSVPMRAAVGQIISPIEQKAAAVKGMMATPEPQMRGMGAATTAEETIRRERAANLPVPIKLSKGEATRDFEQQRFEKETMKNAGVGEPLRQHAADNVGKVIKNFEAWIDETGAEAPDLISTGKAVDRPLVKRMESAKAEIRDAYTKAEKAGEMAEPVNTQPLVDYLNKNASASGEAGVLSAAEKELIRLNGAKRGPDGMLIAGEIPLNDTEWARKMIVRLGKTNETNGHYSGEMNKVIDQMTEGKGGDLYKSARSMFKDYAGEFKNQGAVRKLVSFKPGTSDRAVALEDVFNHAVISGSNQDTANIISSLEKAGPEGLQGVKELKGATINYLLDKTTGNASRDIRNQPIPSFAKMDRAVRALDTDGKLDLLFGKKGAEQIRDLKELIADIQTAPPGAVNNSTTAAVLMDALGSLATGRIPTATAKAIAGLKQAVGDRATMKRVRDALYQPDDLTLEMPPKGSTRH